MPKLLLSRQQRELLKHPLGELIAGSISDCSRRIKEIQDTEKPALLILVGDTISRNAVQHGVKPDVVIVDEKEKRAQAEGFSYGKTRIYRTRNEPGTIDLLAWSAVEEAIEQGDGLVIVDGEEDLLTLPVVIGAPINSVVAYGQPDEGVVIIRISKEKKEEISRILEDMKMVD